MKLKKYLTRGAVIASASAASIVVLAGCGANSSVKKEDLLAKFEEVKNAKSAEIKMTYAMDVNVKESTLSIDLNMKVDGTVDTSYDKNGNAQYESAITTTAFGMESKENNKTYLIKNAESGYDMYTGTSSDGSESYTWEHSTASEDEYSDILYLSELEGDNIKNFKLDGKKDFEGKSCYVLKGDVSISEIADYIGEEGVLSSLTDTSSLSSITDGQTVEVALYFAADTTEFYGVSVDMKTFLSTIMTESMTDSGISDAQITVNDGKLNIVCESINKDITITVPEDVLNSVNK